MPRLRRQTASDDRPRRFALQALAAVVAVLLVLAAPLLTAGAGSTGSRRILTTPAYVYDDETATQ
jgi:hypothetical protein